jgi:hypothetical protein
MGVVDLADGRARGRRRARLGGASRRRRSGVEKVCIWTPDKDLAQCVRDDAWCRSTGAARRSATPPAVRAKFGVAPELIPDWLALVGDAADGYPGIAGIGAVGAATAAQSPRRDRSVPAHAARRAAGRCALFKRLATLRTDAKLFRGVGALRWRGPTPAFAAWTERAAAPRLLERCRAAVGKG